MSVELRITTPLPKPHSTYTHLIIASKNIEYKKKMPDHTRVYENAEKTKK